MSDCNGETVRAFTCDLLQRKVKGLEDDNRKLRAEASQLATESTESELREEQLLHQVVAQLGIQLNVKTTYPSGLTIY